MFLVLEFCLFLCSFVLLVLLLSLFFCSCSFVLAFIFLFFLVPLFLFFFLFLFSRFSLFSHRLFFFSHLFLFSHLLLLILQSPCSLFLLFFVLPSLNVSPFSSSYVPLFICPLCSPVPLFICSLVPLFFLFPFFHFLYSCSYFFPLPLFVFYSIFCSSVLPAP